MDLPAIPPSLDQKILVGRSGSLLTNEEFYRCIETLFFPTYNKIFHVINYHYKINRALVFSHHLEELSVDLFDRDFNSHFDRNYDFRESLYSLFVPRRVVVKDGEVYPYCNLHDYAMKDWLNIFSVMTKCPLPESSKLMGRHD